MKYIVLLNGAPQSGKDTIANMMIEYLHNLVPAFHLKFAEELKSITHDLLGIPNKNYDFIKDNPLEEFGGKCLRDFYKDFGMAARGIFGSEVWVKFVARAIWETKVVGDGWFFVSDCGFQNEYEYFVNGSFAQKHKILLLRVTRDGKNYKNDTRKEVAPLVGVPFAQIHNRENEFDDLRKNVIAILQKFAANA